MKKNSAQDDVQITLLLHTLFVAHRAAHTLKAMDISDRISSAIVELDQEIERLTHARTMLTTAQGAIKGGATTVASPIPPANGARTREQMLLDLLRGAGRKGLTRQEAFKEMARVCDSPLTTISTMLSRLARNGQIHNAEGYWIAN